MTLNDEPARHRDSQSHVVMTVETAKNLRIMVQASRSSTYRGHSRPAPYHPHITPDPAATDKFRAPQHITLHFRHTVM